MKVLTYIFLCLVGMAIAWQIAQTDAANSAPANRGQEVYIAEGCIHCHSQYRRPLERDSILWGSRASATGGGEVPRYPILYGNRRQGPDLANVGERRSREWNRVHLMEPGEIRTTSRMPSYAHLFAAGNESGEALLDYLETLGSWDAGGRMEAVADRMPQGKFENGDSVAGQRLYVQYCAGCHGQEGSGDGPVAASFVRKPRDLRNPASWLWIDLTADDAVTDLARLIRYGQPGTSMAGTEWLNDKNIADLIRYITTLQ